MGRTLNQTVGHWELDRWRDDYRYDSTVSRILDVLEAEMGGGNKVVADLEDRAVRAEAEAARLRERAATVRAATVRACSHLLATVLAADESEFSGSPQAGGGQ